MKVNIGGDRLGSGNKMTTDLRNYSRSTHNLSELWQSSMAPGILYPFLVKPALNGDTFDIDLNTAAYTIPTQGPLFGSYKMQLDVFVVPMRLYQGVLHNNPVNIGMQMKEVKMPKMQIWHMASKSDETNACQFATNSLWKYLGLSGIGTCALPMATGYYRNINAIPLLGYYDIFKTYYANKQENNAYVITPDNVVSQTQRFYSVVGITLDLKTTNLYNGTEVQSYSINMSTTKYRRLLIESKTYIDTNTWEVRKNGNLIDGVIVNVTCTQLENRSYLTQIYLDATKEEDATYIFTSKSITQFSATPILSSFELSNIDDMRKWLLSQNEIGENVILDVYDNDSPASNLPYRTNGYAGTIEKRKMSNNCCKLNGLVVKTYQSDMFNSFVQTDWIDGSNGIAEITAVDVSSGLLLMDALNLQQKLYNMLNRVAISGGTYEDWQEAVYSQEAVRKAETPIYCGGLSKEVVFEEVVSTAETTNESSTTNALGTLGGRGILSKKHKGGKMLIKIKEPSFIMGIVSITPRICYSQGNEWYLTELNTFDDLHKPALDGIGFEDLIGERMAWWDTRINPNEPDLQVRNSYGKLPAWINYMTSFDKVFGDFAEQDGKSYMVLSRNYQRAYDSSGMPYIGDFTTYVDPRKFNYAFAYNELDAQNFWVQIQSDIIARRLMSAKVIPNL